METTTTVSTGASAGIVIFIFLFVLAYTVILLASLWKIFQKMGDAGWVGIVPYLNYYRIFQRSRPEQATILTIATFFCGIPGLVAIWDLGKMFGKSDAYCIGMIFLGFIFLPMLAFGKDQYQGPAIQPM